MDRDTLLSALEFTRARTLGTLDQIEKSGQDPAKVLAWRPGPARAHLAWQAMHCAATHDKYLNVYLKAGAMKDEGLVKGFGGGSTPSDTGLPSLGAIRDVLGWTYCDVKEFVSSLDSAGFTRKVNAGGRERTVAESIILLTWHEGHHQGQMHLTWNLYQAAHGLKV